MTSTGQSELGPLSLSTALDALRDDHGRTLREITNERPTLLVLLRHTGCTFCRQTISDLANCQASITARGVGIAVIGMSDSTSPMRALGNRYGLSNVAWIADPERLAYRSLGIGRGRFLQLLGPRVIWSGLLAALRGHGIGRPEGDVRQMPGTALLHRGAVLREFRHRTAADRPAYQTLACTT